MIPLLENMVPHDLALGSGNLTPRNFVVAFHRLICLQVQGLSQGLWFNPLIPCG